VTPGTRRQRIRRRRVTPSSRLLLGFCAAGVGRAWNAASGQLLRTLAPPGGPRPPRVIGRTSNVRAAVLLCGHLLLVYDVTSGHVVAAATTDGACRRLRATPRGGAIVGVTVDGEPRAFWCQQMAPVRRQTSLQAVKSTLSATS